jgi:hypothetical protein
MTLRIFADPSWFDRGAQLCPLLLPWGAEFCGNSQFRFYEDPYVQTGRNYFARTTPQECDLVICPTNWQNESHNEIVQRLASQAKAWGKPLIVFCEADTEAPFPILDVLAFRGSLRRSARLPNEFPAPAFILDHINIPWPLADAGPQPKTGEPVVGFCGCVDTETSSRFSLKRALNRALYWCLLSRPRAERFLRRCGVRITRSEAKRTRYQAVGVVSRCGRIRKNLRLREHFLNGTLLVPENEQREHWRRSFAQFRDNVLGSHYTLCPRGGGNWSYRFYETLCLGRIPVFFNTDCTLPYELLINWRDYCVWVEGDEIERTAEAILSHYQDHSADSFFELQRRCRQLWIDYLSFDGFFRNFHRHPGFLPQK